ncbi:MAG: uncharacterized protein JWN09_2748 [Microbacteriaceae bacterium]|jgi:hypothetical protein|nr:uncharacterized protein [Microbacteriaceae bacterium]
MSTETMTREISLPAILRRSAVLTWFELPRVVLLGLVSLLAAVPLCAALVVAPWWVAALSSIPLCLLMTGLARFAALIWRGEKPSMRDGLRIDVTLGLSIAAIGTGTVQLIMAGGAPRIVGSILAAVVLVVAPYALAYGGVRQRTGFTAFRGALILVAYRPSWALTALALGSIGAFAVAGSVGALAVIVPCILMVFDCALVARLLDTIDKHGSSR